MDILTCFPKLNVYSLIFLLSAVLGVHNLLNNPKFDEETASSKGGKGPVRSKLMWNLWFCETWEPPGVWEERGLLNGPASDSRLPSCRLRRWLLSVHQGSLGSELSNQNRVPDNENCVGQYN